MILRIFSVCLLLVEVLLISTQFDAQILRNSPDHFISVLLSHTATGVQWIAAAMGSYLVIYITGQAKDITSQPPSSQLSGWLAIVVNLLSFALFYWASSRIFAPTATQATGHIALIWLLAGICVALATARTLLSFRSWWYVIQKQRAALVICALLATLVTGSSLATKNLWPALIYPTFAGVEWLLSSLVGPVISVPSELLLGINHFIVHVSSTCSGLEGMGLAVSFTLLYLFLFKDQLRFPRALVLIPVAAVVSWLLNIVRITALILLGEYVSEEFAVGGFHSQAGWFSFIALAMAIIFVFNKIRWFKRADQVNPSAKASIDQSQAILICFLLLLGGTLVSGLNESEMNWLYPIKALAGTIGLVFFWRKLEINWPDHWLLAIAAGLLTLAVWVLLIPNDPEFNGALQSSLENSSTGAAKLWVTIRFLGSILIVPIIEELVFRSYLMARLSSANINHQRPIPFNAMSLALSSLAFGAIHNQWLAGTIAGLIFGLLRMRANLGSAIIAHATTNAALCIYALLAGQWYYL